MEKQDTNSSKSAMEDHGVRQAKLPDGKEKPGQPSSPDSDENGAPNDRKDRDAIPPTQTKGTNSPESDEEDENDLEKLERWERAIDQYREATLKAAPRVAWITEEKLHRERGYESIGTYADEKFGISRQRWYQFAACGEVLDQLSSKQESTAVDTPLPSNEAQTRPLQSHRGDLNFLWSAWKTAVEEFGPSPRRKDVKSVVDDLTTEDSETDASVREKNRSGKSEVESEPSDLSEDLTGESSSQCNSGSRGSESVSEKSKERNDVGSDSKPQGEFFVDTEKSDVELQAAEGFDNQFSSLTKTDIESLADQTERDKEGFSSSSVEHMVASKKWKVLVPSSEGTGAGLPEENPSGKECGGAVLKPGRLGQITDLDPGIDGERVLVCPGVDLFDGAIPDGPIEAILKRCRKSDHRPVVFTRHLSRASEFDLSGMWVGTSTNRSSLEMTEQRLGDAAPNATVRWLLYDVAQTDKDDAPSFSDKVDWVVYDPGDRNSGIALKLSEVQALIGAAKEVDAEWAFRNSFKTCGASLATPYSSS